MGLDPHGDKPLFGDADGEKIIRAIVIDGETSWTKIKENTSLPSEALNVKLRGFLSRNIVNKSDHYWVDSGIREMYLSFNVEAAIVSSMNFYPASASGVTWEAGIITIDEDVVTFIDKMIHNLLRRPKTVFTF